jgi:hypothetical protein
MGRRFTQRPLYCRSMQTDGTFSFELLLRASRAERLRSHAHESGRRDLYEMAFLWFKENSRSNAEGRTRNKSQTDSGNYAEPWTCWESTRTQYFEGPSSAPQIPVPLTECRDLRPFGSMEFGHHVHPTLKRLCLSLCRDRLVHSISTLIPSLEQLEDSFLFGNIRGGKCYLWSTGYFQYRPGSTVYLSRICRSGTQQRHSIQHGWPRSSARQYFYRTSMEIGKI